jgi:predicted nicotinamide N-methyase
LASPPLVPEIRLHLATEITPLWEMTEAALEQIGLPPPYWAFAWPGSQALARLLLDRPEIARGRRVLDFAAGSGLAAIAAMKAGAASAAAAEIDAYACAAIAANAEANGVVLDLCFGDVTEASGDWDVVLAGDVCYERPMAGRVFAWLERLAAAGRTIFLADPGRAYLPAGLPEIARYAVPTTLELEDRKIRETRIFRLGPDQAVS